MLSGCTLLCRTECRRIEYFNQCNTTCPFPNPCPIIKPPGYYRPDFGCIENLQRLSAIRQRGIGVIILGDRLRFILPTDNLFTRDSMASCGPIDINQCHVSTLADIGEIIKCIPCVPVIITGHTDNVGPRPERFRRSYAMAKAVASHFWAQGIDWNRMKIVGTADCQPISSDASVFGSSDNRRVEIRLDFSRNDQYNCRYNNSYCPDCLVKK